MIWEVMLLSGDKLDVAMILLVSLLMRNVHLDLGSFRLHVFLSQE